MPRNEPSLLWPRSWSYCFTSCGLAERSTSHCETTKKWRAQWPRPTSELPSSTPSSGDCDQCLAQRLSKKRGAEVDYQVAALLKWERPTGTERQSLNKRVRMEGWRQRRRGSNARNPEEGRRKNRLDTHRPSHGRT